MFDDNVKHRFWNKVTKAGAYDCWLWGGALSRNGYGNMNVGGKTVVSAHRIAYLISVGDIPEGMVIMHICDNRKCVNPNHLRVRTQKDNIHDSLWKGRFVKKK